MSIFCDCTVQVSSHTQQTCAACVCPYGVQLSHTALGNLMSPLCPEEGNRDLGLELQTLTLAQAHRQKE